MADKKTQAVVEEFGEMEQRLNEENPGIAELLEVYGNYEEVEAKVHNYFAPQPLPTVVNSTGTLGGTVCLDGGKS